MLKYEFFILQDALLIIEVFAIASSKLNKSCVSGGETEMFNQIIQFVCLKQASSFLKLTH